MAEIMNISGIKCYEKNGTAYLNLEAVAHGLGFTTVAASGNEVVRWNTVYGYLSDLKVVAGSCNGDYRSQCPAFIPENIFYRLAMKAKNEAAEAFQAIVADEIIPSIRKTGSYSVKEKQPTKKLPLSSFNHLLEINIRQMKEADEPASHIAAWTNGMTRDVLAPFGINVPALPDAVPPTYDATEMAKKLGIYSKAGKPHPQPITAIIKAVGLTPQETFTTATTAHGGKKDVPDVRYTESVLEKVHGWLDDAGWPNSIVLGKTFNVIYKSGGASGSV